MKHARAHLFVSIVLGTSLALAAPERGSADPAFKRIATLGAFCEGQRAAPAKAFERFLLDPKRARAGWTIALQSPDSEVRLAHAKQIAKAARGTLERFDSVRLGKYIGETEKNLDVLFAEAAQKDWILFFDEADALFGKRTEISDAHDRYANQEVSYLRASPDHLAVTPRDNGNRSGRPLLLLLQHISTGAARCETELPDKHATVYPESTS